MRAQAQTGTLIYRDFFRPIPRDTAEFRKNIKHLYGDFKGKFRDSAAIAVNQGPWPQPGGARSGKCWRKSPFQMNFEHNFCEVTYARKKEKKKHGDQLKF